MLLAVEAGPLLRTRKTNQWCELIRRSTRTKRKQIFNDILNTFSVWHSVCSEVFCALEKNTVVGASRAYITSTDLIYWTNKLAVKTLVAPKMTPRDPSLFIVQVIIEWVFTLPFDWNKWWRAWKSKTEEPSATPHPAPQLGVINVNWEGANLCGNQDSSQTVNQHPMTCRQIPWPNATRAHHCNSKTNPVKPKEQRRVKSASFLIFWRNRWRSWKSSRTVTEL